MMYKEIVGDNDGSSVRNARGSTVHRVELGACALLAVLLGAAVLIMV